MVYHLSRSGKGTDMKDNSLAVKREAISIDSHYLIIAKPQLNLYLDKGCQVE